MFKAEDRYGDRLRPGGTTPLRVTILNDAQLSSPPACHNGHPKIITLKRT